MTNGFGAPSRRAVAGLLAAVGIALGGLAAAGARPAEAFCSDMSTCPFSAHVQLTVEPHGSVTGGWNLPGGVCTSANSPCNDSSVQIGGPGDEPVYTATPASGFALDHWDGCSVAGNTTATCTVNAAWSVAGGSPSDVHAYFRDVAPPAVALAAPSPAADSAVDGLVSLAATASDNVGVSKVSWTVTHAGTPVVGPTDTSSTPYGFSWETSGLADGSYTVTATAYDAAGNLASATRTYAVVHPPAPPASGPAQGSGAGQNAGSGSGPGVSAPSSLLRLDAAIQLAAKKGKVTRFSRLRIVGAPRGARVTLLCHGGGCRFKSKGATAGTAALDLTKLVRSLKLKPGAYLELRLTAAGYSPEDVRFTARRGRAPLRRTI